MIAERIGRDADRLREEFAQLGHIQTCVVDDLLDPDLALDIYRRFPSIDECDLHKNVREYKYVAAQMDKYDPVLEELEFAFQEPEVREIVGSVTGRDDMQADLDLFAAGLSLMAKDNYLTPHLDDSHDGDGKLYRTLNLLYYVSPDWTLESGGNLELWDSGLNSYPRTVVSKFNRLALMGVTRRSWHSVSKVVVDGVRCCVSNYYFAERARDLDGTLMTDDYRHVTEFRAFPGDTTSDVLLRTDSTIKNLIRKFYKRPMRDKHRYHRAD